MAENFTMSSFLMLMDFGLRRNRIFLSIAVLRMKMEYPRGVRLSRLSPYSFWTSLRLNYGGRDQHDELHLPS